MGLETGLDSARSGNLPEGGTGQNKRVNEFIQAIKDGDTARVSAMLRDDSSLVDTRDTNGASAVQTAVYNFHPNIAGFLVESGAKLDLASACCFGATAKVEDLADKDNVNVLTSDGFCLLALAAAFGGAETTQVLIDAGADLNLKSTALGGVAAIHACIFGRNNKVLRVLIDAGAKVDLGQGNGFTALMGAAMNKDVEAFQMLLEAGADRTLKTDDGKTAQDYAVESGNAEVQALLA